MKSQYDVNSENFIYYKLTSEQGTIFSKFRRSRMFFKIGVLKNFAIFTGKHLCRVTF